MAATLSLSMSDVIQSALVYAKANSRKLIKFVVVTGASVIFGQALFAFLLYGMDFAYVRANIIAVAIMVMPNYLFNRYWVWGKKSKNSFATEVLPFWVMAFIGFAFSTFAVWLVDGWGWPKFAALIANFVAYGVVWVFKFFVMEKYIFSSGSAADEAPTSQPISA